MNRVVRGPGIKLSVVSRSMRTFILLSEASSGMSSTDRQLGHCKVRMMAYDTKG